MPSAIYGLLECRTSSGMMTFFATSPNAAACVADGPESPWRPDLILKDGYHYPHEEQVCTEQ
jgi:hypothetical protein